MDKLENRFARHNSFGPPSGFRPTLSYSPIVHCLSGLSKYAFPQNYHPKGIQFGQWCGSSANEEPSHLFYFHCALENEFSTQILAYLMNSLVRVSRRVVRKHFVNILFGIAECPNNRAVQWPHVYDEASTTRDHTLQGNEPRAYGIQIGKS